MTEPAAFVRRVTEIERPAAGSLEARASLAFKAMAFINVAGVVLAMFAPLNPVSNLLAVTFSAAAALLAALYVIEARALDRCRPWAVSAARPLLALLVLSGGYSVFVALDGGMIRAPFDGLLALWALLGRRDATLVSGAVRRAALLVGAVVALLAAMALAQPLFGWGGLVDVHEADLDAAIVVDCGAPTAGPPSSLTVSYDWSWRSTSPLPNETDILVIGWTGADPEGRPLYVIGDIPGSGAGIYSGRAGYPSTQMASQLARGSEASFRWAIRLSERGYEPGHIELQLTRPRAAPAASTSVAFTAFYVHLGVWHHMSTTTCAW